MTVLTTVAIQRPGERSLVGQLRVKTYIALWRVQNSVADSARQSFDL